MWTNFDFESYLSYYYGNIVFWFTAIACKYIFQCIAVTVTYVLWSTAIAAEYVF